MLSRRDGAVMNGSRIVPPKPFHQAIITHTGRQSPGHRH
jgi:hypothetical protein